MALCVCMSVHPSVRKYVRHEMRWEQTAGPKGVNYGAHVQVYKVSVSTNFQPNRQRLYLLFNYKCLEIHGFLLDNS